VDDLFMAPEMHALVDSLRQTADIIFIVTSNVHDARSKALIDVADSVILEVVQGVSSYRDLHQASNDYTLVADKLLGVVYVANAGSRGRRARPSAERTHKAAKDTRKQVSSGKTSVKSELGSKKEIAPVDQVAPDETIRSGDIQPIRLGDIPSDDTIRPGDIQPIRPDTPPDDTIRPGDIQPIRLGDIPPDDTMRPGEFPPIRPDEESYDPPPWSNGSNGAVRGIAAGHETSPSVPDHDLAAPRPAGR